MDMLLGFLPFIAFSILDSYVGPTAALSVGALIAAALVIRAWLSPQRRFKILETGTVILLAGLAVYTALSGTDPSLIAVQLCVNMGLLLIVLVSLAIRHPFTLQYAREQVEPAHWNSPRFIRTNYIITTGWAVAFAVMVVTQMTLLMNPTIPLPVGFAAMVLAMIGASAFTGWYSKRAKHAAAAS